jgi:hypothetical protein
VLEDLIVQNYIDNTQGRTEINIGWSILEELTFNKEALECLKIALSMVERVVEKCQDEDVLSRLGAGVVESLLKSDFPEIYNRILELAKKDDYWESILRFTWFRHNDAYRVISVEFPYVVVMGNTPQTEEVSE